MDEQERVARFVAENDMECPPAYRLLDLAAEVGELAADANDATGYGADPDAFDVKRDELGDALFALLALCDDLGVDAGAALDESLAKYGDRVAETGDAGS
ncbi:MazG-like family protein [Halosegnis marinus]|uniref:MazG-like family protein n=1 Tax=Halosegnis marinus TaxID=3034023 RepID=A0ABD5ZRV9_9EURY|nr:MazG-like family protein [Halosegnis sp. DT85]